MINDDFYANQSDIRIFKAHHSSHCPYLYEAMRIKMALNVQKKTGKHFFFQGETKVYSIFNN